MSAAAAADESGDAILTGDEDAMPSPSERPLSMADLTIQRSSTLKDADGTGAETIVAVEFDIVAAMAASIALRTKRCNADDVSTTGTAWSITADGGPIRRSALTQFSLTLSAPRLVAGRAAMVPMLYICAEGPHVHSA